MSLAKMHEDQHRAPGTRRARPRTCVGCGCEDGRSALVRFVLGPGGLVAVDTSDGGFGRGAHVHARPECLARAAAGGLARAAKSPARIVSASGEPVDLTAVTLAEALAAAQNRRFVALLGAAVRARRAAVGTRAVEDACHRGEAKVVVVARDAAAAASVGEVRRAVAEGRALAWGTKSELAGIVRPGRALGDGESGGVALVAVLDDRIAAALKQTMVALDACAAARDVRPAGRSGGRRRGELDEGREAGNNRTERGA